MKIFYLLLLTIVMLSSCATSYCPNERSGSTKKRHDPNLNRHVAVKY